MAYSIHYIAIMIPVSERHRQRAGQGTNGFVHGLQHHCPAALPPLRRSKFWEWSNIGTRHVGEALSLPKLTQLGGSLNVERMRRSGRLRAAPTTLILLTMCSYLFNACNWRAAAQIILAFSAKTLYTLSKKRLKRGRLNVQNCVGGGRKV